MYNPYGYQPYASPEQRLKEFEKYYSQYGFGQSSQPQTPEPVVPPPGITMKEVTVEDEARTSAIDYTGETHFFVLKDKSKIFAKRLNTATGDIDFDIYTKPIPIVADKAAKPAQKSEEDIKIMIDKLRSDFNVKMGNMKSDIIKAVKEELKNSNITSCENSNFGKQSVTKTSK